MANINPLIPFNPLEKKQLGKIVAERMLESAPEKLPPEQQFIGAGIYAIYYLGSFVPYKKISTANRGKKLSQPIYVGKAIPAGARKGGIGLDENPGTVLCRRLSEHASSIEEAENLEVSDFRCRYLVVDDIWIPLAESILIEMFNPLWNMVLDGFGNHNPGKGRYQQQISCWDVLHPGREWAKKCKSNNLSKQAILSNVNNFLSKR